MRFITDGEVFELTPVFLLSRRRTTAHVRSVEVSEIDCLAGGLGARPFRHGITLPQTEAGGRYRATHGQRGLADSTRPELDADSWADGPCCLRHRMLPSPLAGTAHHQQVAMTDLVFDCDAAAAWPEQEVPGGAE
jgi:hypothetical protein